MLTDRLPQSPHHERRGWLTSQGLGESWQKLSEALGGDYIDLTVGLQTSNRQRKQYLICLMAKTKSEGPVSLRFLQWSLEPLEHIGGVRGTHRPWGMTLTMPAVGFSLLCCVSGTGHTVCDEGRTRFWKGSVYMDRHLDKNTTHKASLWDRTIAHRPATFHHDLSCVALLVISWINRVVPIPLVCQSL